MNEKLNQYRGAFSQYWQRFTNTQKWMLAGSAVLLIVVMLVVILSFAKTEYSTAFTDLQPADAAAIKTYLDTNSIPYQLSPDGTTIGVPTNMVADVRLNVESQGLNQNGSLGFGIFRNNMSGFGTTENEFNVLKVDAIAGEIQQMLNKINGVSSSKVLITIPEQSVFVSSEDKTEATASVVIDVKPGFVIEQDKIDTMYRLVAKSVPGLSYDNITISNTDMDFLAFSEEGESTAANVVAGNLQIKKQFEMDLQKKVKRDIGMMYGQSNVVVTVSASMNFDQKSTQRKNVSPVGTDSNRGIPISEEIIQKNQTSESTEGGTVGTGETDVTNTNSPEASGTSSSEESESRTNFEVNREDQQIVSSPFSLQDLAINVALEGNNITEAEQTEIREYLANLVRTNLAESSLEFEEGTNLVDGDFGQRVKLVIRPAFSGKTVIEEPTNITTYLLLGGLALAIVAGGLIFFLRRRQARVAEEEVKRAAEMAAEAAEQQQGKILDIELATNENQIRRQLEALARKKPEEFVSILRSWILEE